MLPISENERVRGLRECLRRWGLRIERRMGGGMTSAVFACVDSDGRRVVLKMGPAEMRPELEAAALSVWAGRGAPLLLDFAPKIGALLLECIEPGTPLPPDNDEEAIASIVGTLKALHTAEIGVPDRFPGHTEALRIYFGRQRANAEPRTIGLKLVDKALETSLELAASCATDVVLLHGDFIDKNLLLGPDGYVAVDPMLPRIGDPCSDVGFYAAYHPPARRIAERARALARAAGLDPERSARWATIWAVGEATETWRRDSDELQTWVGGEEATDLLNA